MSQSIKDAFRKYVSNSFTHLQKINEDGSPWAVFAAAHFAKSLGVELPGWLQVFSQTFGLNAYKDGKLVGELITFTHDPASVSESCKLTADVIAELEAASLDKVSEFEPPDELLPVIYPIGFRQFYLNQPL